MRFCSLLLVQLIVKSFPAAVLAVVVAMVSVLLVPVASAQTVEDVTQRDQLIANQENLLNTYRCLFGVDVDVVPGQCPNPDPVSPGVAPDSPTQQDIDVRDDLIANQEALLNVYRCRFDVDTEIVPGGCTGGEPAPAQASLPHADWFPDPTCRNSHRWWSGLRWTGDVANSGASSEDPLRSGESYPPPVEGETPDCSGPVPLSAEVLGCTGPNPACRIGDDGWPVATRLVGYQELVATNGYASDMLHPHAPDADNQTTLGYLTTCLQEWSLFVPSRYDELSYGGTPVQTCSMVWGKMAYALNHLGADTNVQCVWDAFESFYLRNGQANSRYAYTGWAEKCGSWLDPYPVRQISVEECPAPVIKDGGITYSYYQFASQTPLWAQYNASARWPDQESHRQWWCGFHERCEDLWGQIAPIRSASGDDPCARIILGEEINAAWHGRCDELLVLNKLVNTEGTAEREQHGSQLPTVPPVPDTMLIAC